MAKIPEVIDCTGSHLTRYKLKDSSGMIEEIDLEFYPGDDFKQGTLFSATFMNPIIAKINGHDISPITNVEVNASAFTDSVDFTKYPYQADIPIQGLLASDFVIVNPSVEAKTMMCLAGDNQSFNGILRLYATKIPTSNIMISSILINRRDSK